MPAATRIWTGREGSSRRAQREPCPADTWISAQWYRLWTSGFQNCCLTSLCWFVTTATRNEYTSEQTTPKRRGRTRQSVFLAGGLRAGRGSANQARLRGGGSAPSPTLLLGPAGGRSTVGQREPPSAWTQNWNIVTSTRVPWPSQPHEPAQRGDPGEVSEPQAARSAPEKPASTAILCNTCGNVCRGEVLRVQSKYFHIQCFVCKECGCDLAEGGFFVRQGEYICTQDYQRLYGTRCFSCDQFIEGEVVSALGKTYHPNCFVCAVCRLPFPPGDRVTFNGKECMCQKCSLPTSAGSSVPLSQGLWSCKGCGVEIKNGQSLVALEKHWHLGCFKCKTCGKQLNAEYISKDGLPYCEADYHSKFGIRCDGCEKYITGHVLEAGEKHFHPLCALCVGCGRMFAEGEEMYLQGSSIWHPACRQAARTEDKSKETRTSSESIISVPASSTSGSPSRVIYAKLGDEILDYRDLAALPKNKAIYSIDRPDMISYSPFISHSVGDRQSCSESPRLLSPTPPEGYQDDRSYKQCRTSSPSSTGSVSLGRYTPTLRSPQHYSRPAGTLSVGTSSCLSLSQHPSPTSVFRHHYIPYFRGSESGRSTSSLSVLSDSKPPPSTYQQAPRHFHVPDTGVKDNIYRKPPIYKQHGPVAQSPISKLSGLMSVLSLVVHKAGCSKRLEGPSPPQAAAGRRSDGEDGSFDADNRKKTNWLLLKGDGDTRTNSPDLDSQSLAHSSGTDRGPLQTMPGDNIYSRFPYSKSDPVPGHGKNGLDHRVGTGPARPPQHMRTNGHRELGWLPQLGDHTARRTGPGDPAHPPTSACCSTQGQTTTRQHPSSPLLPAPSPQGDLSVGGQGQRGHPEESDPL
ncbi:actin-binding LIM protein 2 isoform X2 [Delphinapterus leucas]|uniref:Actin-binding LIM protein 2 isoform X2 n=1 Tax=Delphinapterus leucas TaxID=9749 RepID=A0A2Y9LL82_DELLE|nr:actin-binding LIM protein 2 isoform X2 [Delphinapterus leucas]